MLEHAIQAVGLAVVVYFALRFVMAARSRIPPDKAHALVEAGAQLVDVRSPAEFASGALPGAINLPVQSLRQKMGELSKDSPVIVYCASGMRSARAASVLKTAGFEVHDLGPKAAW